jgi:hypothetical protein
MTRLCPTARPPWTNCESLAREMILLMIPPVLILTSMSPGAVWPRIIPICRFGMSPTFE